MGCGGTGPHSNFCFSYTYMVYLAGRPPVKPVQRPPLLPLLVHLAKLMKKPSPLPLQINERGNNEQNLSQKMEKKKQKTMS